MIPTCPVCGDTPAGHSAEACLEIVARQRDNAIRERDEARQELERREEQGAIVRFLWRKK